MICGTIRQIYFVVSVQNSLRIALENTKVGFKKTIFEM